MCAVHWSRIGWKHPGPLIAGAPCLSLCCMSIEMLWPSHVHQKPALSLSPHIHCISVHQQRRFGWVQVEEQASYAYVYSWSVLFTDPWGGGRGGGEESFMLTRGLEIGLPASVSGYAHAFSCTDMVSCSICPHFNCRRRMLLTGRR